MAKKKKTAEPINEAEAKQYFKDRRIKLVLNHLLGFFVFLITLIPWHFAVRSCSDFHTTLHNVTIVQPESEQWELKVNDKQGSFKIHEQTTLDIVVSPKTSFYEAIDSLKTSNEDVCYYVQVAPTSKKQVPTWTNELTFIGQEKGYKASFPMAWTCDITISIITSTAYQDSYFTKVGDDIAYLYDKSTIYNPSLGYITRIKTEDLSAEKINRTDFKIDVGDGKLYIGDKITKLSDSFLEGCTAFNSPIVFPSNGMLTEINDLFLYGCTSFNQPLDFPSTLTTIKGNFMYNCTSFNQPFSFANITDTSKCTSFMANNTSFNNTIDLSLVKEVPLYFLVNCYNFNQNVYIPSTVKTMNVGFLCYCNNMTSTVTVDCATSAFYSLSYNEHMCSTSKSDAACVTSGIKINGTAKDQFVSWLPNLNVSTNETMYRKLIKVA